MQRTLVSARRIIRLGLELLLLGSGILEVRQCMVLVWIDISDLFLVAIPSSLPQSHLQSCLDQAPCPTYALSCPFSFEPRHTRKPSSIAMDRLTARLSLQNSPKRLPGDKIRTQTKDQPLTAPSTGFGQAKGFGTPATSSGTSLFGQPSATATSSGGFGFGAQSTPFGGSGNSGGLFGGQKTGFGAGSKSSEEQHIFFIWECP